MKKPILYFITDNEHKFIEASRVMLEHGIELKMLRGFKVELQGTSLRDIAVIAARRAYLELKLPLVIEDTGLFIKALKGFPGPYSSYVFKTIGVNGILRLMDGIEDRTAIFKTCLACIYPPYELVITSEVRGYISDRPRGDRGFGFDPIFIPEGSTKTFAEMSVDEKNRWSHRAKAFKLLAMKLRNIYKNTTSARIKPESEGIDYE